MDHIDLDDYSIILSKSQYEDLCDRSVHTVNDYVFFADKRGLINIISKDEALKRIEEVNNELYSTYKELNAQIVKFNKLPWYKKIFYVFKNI